MYSIHFEIAEKHVNLNFFENTNSQERIMTP